MAEGTPVTKNLEENEVWFRSRCEGCADIKLQPMLLGKGGSVHVLAIYVENTVPNLILEESVLGRMFIEMTDKTPGEVYQAVEANSLGLSEAEPLPTREEAMDAMLAGNLLLLVDGYNKGLKIGSKGYPSRSVNTTDTEKVLRGSNEGFTESVKTNTALIRKRIRSTDLKVEELTAGVRSNTRLVLVYMKELVYPEVLEQIRQGIDRFVIDGVLDSGIIEQLTEENWVSPFPQFQTTERPDLAAMEVLDGRVVLLSDNSPVALLLPSAFQDFMNVTEDRYNRFEIASFERLIRYAAMVFSFLLSGTYLAVIGFHTMILPTNLILSFAESRQGVPFPSLLEVLFMELAFELIREAGIRMPGALSGTIGIVGGLIIGDAAVSANLVSPMAVVVVALSALSSFAIPNEECTSAFRLIKYGFILLGGLLGMYGIVLGLYLLFGHLARLTSFQIPYLMPFTGKEVAGYRDERDLLVRAPMRRMRYRPIYAVRSQRIRLRENQKVRGDRKHVCR